MCIVYSMDLRTWAKQDGNSLSDVMRRSGLAWTTVCEVAKLGYAKTRETAHKISAATNGEVSLLDLWGEAPAPAENVTAETCDSVRRSDMESKSVGE